MNIKNMTTVAILFISSLYGNEDPFVTEVVTITAGKEQTEKSEAVVSVDVINQEEIEMSGATSLLEVVTSVPYIQHKHHSGEDYLQFQGLEGGYVVILIDGVPVTGDVMSGQFPIDNIDVKQVERVEITKGPNSTLYGSSAMAGVINIITTNGESYQKEGGSGKVSTEYASNNMFNGRVNYSHQLKRLGISTTLGVLLDDGYTERVGGAVKFNNYILPERQNYSGSFGLRFNRTESAWFSLNYNHNKKSELSSNVNSPSIRIDGADQIKNLTFSYSEPRNSVRLAGHVVYKSFAHQEEGNRVTTNTKEYSTDYTFDDIEAEQRITIPIDNITLIAGVNGLYETTINKDLSSPEENRSNGALFTQLSLVLNSITLEGGGRLLYNTSYGWNGAGHAGAKVNFTEQFTSRLSFGRGYRTPSFKDLFYYWEHPSPRFLVLGNPDLRPEISHSTHLQFNYEPSRSVALEASGFYHKIEDKIGYTNPFSQESPGEATAININEAWRGGGEFSGNILVGAVRINLGYGYTAGEDHHDGEIQESFEIVPHSFTYLIDYYAPFDMTVTLNGKINSSRQYPKESSYDEETLGLLNGAVRYGWFESKLTATIGIRNILNFKTTEFNQQEGITVYGRLCYEF